MSTLVYFFLVQVQKWSLLDKDLSIPGGELGT